MAVIFKYIITNKNWTKLEYYRKKIFNLHCKHKEHLNTCTGKNRNAVKHNTTSAWINISITVTHKHISIKLYRSCFSCFAQILMHPKVWSAVRFFDSPYFLSTHINENEIENGMFLFSILQTQSAISYLIIWETLLDKVY